jgi:hypothetical protein
MMIWRVFPMDPNRKSNTYWEIYSEYFLGLPWANPSQAENNGSSSGQMPNQVWIPAQDWT